MTLIDGKATAAKIKEEIAEEVRQIVAAGGKRPHLAAILVGHDGGSETYVKNKVLACEACGFTSTLIRFEDDVKEEELLSKVRQLNEDKDERCGRIPSHQRRAYVNRSALLHFGYSAWYHHPAEALWRGDQW